MATIKDALSRKDAQKPGLGLTESGSVGEERAMSQHASPVTPIAIAKGLTNHTDALCSTTETAVWAIRFASRKKVRSAR